MPELTKPHGGQILFVDDDEGMTSAMRRLLPFIGYPVESFTDSAEALQAFKKNPDQFRLLIADLMMPGMNGQELANKIHQVKRELPVIFCTGYFEDSRPSIHPEHADILILQKPPQLAHLREILEEVLGETSSEH